MLSSGIIDLAIGLAFVFGVTAALASVVTELISRFLGLRGEYLLGGLRELLDGKQVETDLTKVKDDYLAWKGLVSGNQTGGVPQSATGAVLGSPILRSQGMVGDITSRKLLVKAGKPGRPEVKNAVTNKRASRSDLRSLPAYISPASFADAVIDLMVPNAAGQTTLDDVEKGLQSAEQKKQLHDAMAPLMESFQALVTTADKDIASVRSAVENWYNDHMDRVSGWYKRYVAKITIVVGAILVILLNLNTISIGRALYSNNVIGSAVSTAAANHPPCSTADSACLARLQTDLSAVAQSGLPIGWATVAGCTAPHTSCNWLEERGILSPSGAAGPSAWQVILVIIGFLLTILALTPGARFWFDLLGKFGVLRSTGPKPSAPAPSTPSAVLIPPAVAAPPEQSPPPEQPPPSEPPPPPEPSTAPEPSPVPAG